MTQRAFLVSIGLIFVSMGLSCRAEGNKDKLMSVERFALGGVGVAGTESEEEQIFRSVLRESNALSNFKEVARKGTQAAQVYALCGIRLLEPKELEAFSAAIIKQGGEIETIRGCMIAKEPVERVVRQVCDGTLDPLLKNPRW